MFLAVPAPRQDRTAVPRGISPRWGGAGYRDEADCRSILKAVAEPQELESCHEADDRDNDTDRQPECDHDGVAELMNGVLVGRIVALTSPSTVDAVEPRDNQRTRFRTPRAPSRRQVRAEFATYQST
jgi:hypothetical protein